MEAFLKTRLNCEIMAGVRYEGYKETRDGDRVIFSVD